MIHLEMMWQWCRGCQIFFLNPVQDKSPNTNERDMQCTEAGVVIALRRRVEHAQSSRKEVEFPENGNDYDFFGRDREDVLPILSVKCRNSSNGCMGPTAVDRQEASDYASSFVTAFMNIHEKSGIQENPGEIRQ